ncbi:MAG: hypothetical protein V4623_04510, partial [Pseudomonadota bacterium]
MRTELFCDDLNFFKTLTTHNKRPLISSRTIFNQYVESNAMDLCSSEINHQTPNLTETLQRHNTEEDPTFSVPPVLQTLIATQLDPFHCIDKMREDCGNIRNELGHKKLSIAEAQVLLAASYFDEDGRMVAQKKGDGQKLELPDTRSRRSIQHKIRAAICAAVENPSQQSPKEISDLLYATHQLQDAAKDTGDLWFEHTQKNQYLEPPTDDKSPFSELPEELQRLIAQEASGALMRVNKRLTQYTRDARQHLSLRPEILERTDQQIITLLSLWSNLSSLDLSSLCSSPPEG